MMRRMRKKDKPLGSHNGSVREEKENRGRTSRHVAKQDGNVERKEEEKPALVHTRPYATTTNTASISNRYAHKCANKHASVTLCYDYRFHTSLYKDDCIGKEKKDGRNILLVVVATPDSYVYLLPILFLGNFFPRRA